MHRYIAYELLVASEIELPELVPAVGMDAAVPDVRITLGNVPGAIEAPDETRVTWTARPDEWLHEIDGVARYFVTGGGSDVRIEPTGGDAADLRAFLLASTLGAILHQRRLFVLHAGAVATPAGAVSVCGPSGAGKSTTLAELTRRGYPVLSDDKTVVRFAGAGPEVISGFPTLRLWHDAVDRIGEDADGLPALRKGIRKYLYRAPDFQSTPERLGLLVVLHRRREEPRDLDDGTYEAPGGVFVTPLGRHDRVGVILRQTYRRRIVDGSGLRREHFGWAARLAATVPVVRIVRPRDGESVGAVVDAIEAVADGLPRTGLPEPA